MEKINTGDKVELISRRTESTYRVSRLYKNVKGEVWAECLNLDTDQTADHPIRDLRLIKEK